MGSLRPRWYKGNKENVVSQKLHPLKEEGIFIHRACYRMPKYRENNNRKMFSRLGNQEAAACPLELKERK